MMKNKNLKKLKILIVGVLPPPYFGPSITYDSLLSSSFSEKYEIHFVSANYCSDFQNLNKLNFAKVVLFFKYLIEVIKILMMNRPDYVLYTISFNNPAFIKDYLILFACRLFRKKIIEYAHGNGLPEFYQNSNRLIKFLIDDLMFHSCAGIVLGHCLKYNFQKYFPQDKIFVVESGIKVDPELIRLRENNPYKNGHFNVLYLGNLVENKGVFDVIKTAPLVKERVQNVKFIIAGTYDKNGTQLEQKITDYICEKKLETMIEFTGKVLDERKREVLLKADVLVFPTYYFHETFGLVNLEAMQAGIPVLSTPRGAIPEIIENEVNGFIVPEKTPDAIAEKIVFLYNHPEIRQEMGSRNNEKFSRMYTSDAYGRRMCRVFETLGEIENKIIVHPHSLTDCQDIGVTGNR